MKMYTWTMEIQVADFWVADGFDMNENRVQTIKDCLIGSWNYDYEVKVKVLTRPSEKSIRKEQGYET